MKWLLSLTGISPYMILAVIAVGTGLFFFGRYEGGHAQRLEDAAALADAQAKTIVQMKAADQITLTISAVAELKLAEIHMTTLNLILRTKEYVSPKIDAAFPLPVGLVRLHDVAASGMSYLPDTSGQPNDTASAVTASTLGAAIASNYGQCRAEAVQLTALQKWVTDQRANAGH